jgi:ABC-type nitrate/sulfonate/bicarbonate transport system substrate-binding protein
VTAISLRRVVLAALLGVVAVAAAIAPGAVARSDAPKLDSLTIAYPGRNPVTMFGYIAAAKHFFQKQNLSVTISDGNGANVSALVVSGRADIGFLGTSAPLNVAAQGKGTSIILGIAGGGAGGGLVGAPGRTDSIAKLKALGSCRIAALPAGTSAWAYAAIYNSSLGLNCDIVPLPSVATMAAALAAGRVDAAVSAVADFKVAIDAKQAVLLVDPGKLADRQRYIGPASIDSLEWGLTANLQSKKSAIVRYVRAINEARKYAKSLSDEQVAKILYRFSSYRDRTLDQLTYQVHAVRNLAFLGSTNGYITSGQWQRTLENVKRWGIPGFDPSNPVFSYSARVDMSYYVQAIGKPRNG